MKHRLLLFALLLALGSAANAQSNIIAQADEAMQAGLYKAAYELYSQAYKHDSKNIALANALGDAARLSNDYRNAIRHYLVVCRSNVSRQYSECNFYLAQMYKCNGQPDSALFYYERYTSSLPANEELYARARQELRSCQWVLDDVVPQSNFKVTHESKNVNTENAESGAILIGDSLLLFSSMQMVGKSQLPLYQIYQTDVSMAGKPGPALPLDWGLNSKNLHSCNVAYDARNKVIYFNRCKTDNFSSVPCDLYVTRQNKKGKWSSPVRMGGDVNLDGYSSTQPTVGYLPDSSVILYFSSNRPGGLGGFDIWYTVISPDGKCSPCVNLGSPINTPGDEITPFYSPKEGLLYFSSDWHYGYGGFDVFAANGSRDTWSWPENLGNNLNSPANDLYFSVNLVDSSEGYLTSNRKGTSFIAGNTCCNDIYHWTAIQRKKHKPAETPAPTYCSECAKHKPEVLALLPIRLYFHNDQPNPKSKSPKSSESYFQLYNRYMFMRDDYKAKQRQFADSASVDSICAALDFFFDEEVHRNCQNFEQVIDLLTDDLRNGRRVRLTVNGYASPIFNDKYNFNLSKRRIATIVNQLMLHNNSELTHFIGKSTMGSLQINEVAYGSRTAGADVSASYKDPASSIWSVEAARERRIEIIDYQYLDDDSTLISCLRLPNHAINVGTFFTGETATLEVHLSHFADLEKTLDFISVGNPDVTVTGYSKLTPGKELVIYLKMDNRHAEPTVSSFLPLTLRVKGEQVTQTIFLEYSIQK